MNNPGSFDRGGPYQHWMPFVLRICETPWGNAYWIERWDGRVVYRGRGREQNLPRQLDVLEFLLDWAADKKIYRERSRWMRWDSVDSSED